MKIPTYTFFGLSVFVAYVLGATVVYAFLNRELQAKWLRWLALGSIIAFIPIFALVSVQAFQDHVQVQDEDQIGQVVLQGTASELAWYKHPMDDRTAQLEQYFVPIAKGGQRLDEIVAGVKRLRDKKWRYADTASMGLLITKVSIMPNGQAALVETSEVWFAPVVETNGGTETFVPRTSSQINIVTPSQLYVLKKDPESGGVWLIQSNPAPSPSQ